MAVGKTSSSETDFRPYGALYLHIPFCAKRCNYCDFPTKAVSAGDAEIEHYVERLIREIREASRSGLLGSVETVYIGGGTPTFIGNKRLVNLIYTLSLSLNLHPETEFTVEANPESLTLPMVKDLFSLGVTRMSIGVQSFDDKELAALGRVHDAATARSAIETARKRIENVSVDLMCGIPKQDLRSFQASIETAVESEVSHISVYPLTVEPDTAFAGQIDRDLMKQPDEDQQADMMEVAARFLQGRGFTRYEVASWAVPGFSCKHNSAYWTGVPYLGLGSGAVGMRENASGRQRLKDGEVLERLTPTQAMIEDLMLGMRMSCGVSADKVTRVASEKPGILDVFTELQALELVAFDSGRYVPTPRAWLLGNEVYGRIWAAADGETETR
ncbi:MAG TPA: coproporphyrinogen III oxidase [Coriobacteriia bacterium]|nr:coproporphyrinogen III oxidase [Coriobacteriia bacterium]